MYCVITYNCENKDNTLFFKSVKLISGFQISHYLCNRRVTLECVSVGSHASCALVRSVSPATKSDRTPGLADLWETDFTD